jgi:large subunit ribosomal protein L18
MQHEKVNARQRQRRRYRVRNHLKKNTKRARLTVFRSLQHIYAQIVDDAQGRTLAAASTVDKDLRGQNKDAAKVVGRAIAERALAAGVREVAFDRREYQYHGRVAALADAAREAGLAL